MTGLFCYHEGTKRHYKKLDVDVMDNERLSIAQDSTYGQQRDCSILG
jgi:hypothetical protein